MVEMDIGDEIQQLRQPVHSNLDRSRSNVTIVGGGAIVINSAPVRGHRLEDLKWGRGTSKPKQGSQPREKSINKGGGHCGSLGGGGGPSIITLTLFVG